METDAQHLALIVIASLIIVGLIGAVLFFHRQARQVVAVADVLAHQTEENEKHLLAQLEDIHMLVNSRHDEALDRIASLEKRLGVPPGQ